MKIRLTILILTSSVFLGAGQATKLKSKPIRTITSDELLKIKYDDLQAIDTITAYRLCKKYPTLHNWETQEKIIKEFKSEEYLKSNFDAEIEESRRQFIRDNYIYNFDLGEKVKCKTLLTKSKKNQFDITMIKLITTLINNIDTAIVISEYIHGILVVELTIKATTNFYSDNSIEFIKTSDSCSDVPMNNTITCDSVRSTIKYDIDSKRNRIVSNETVKKFPYSYDLKRKR